MIFSAWGKSNPQISQSSKSPSGNLSAILWIALDSQFWSDWLLSRHLRVAIWTSRCMLNDFRSEPTLTREKSNRGLIALQNARSSSLSWSRSFGMLFRSNKAIKDRKSAAGWFWSRIWLNDIFQVDMTAFGTVGSRLRSLMFVSKSAAWSVWLLRNADR